MFLALIGSITGLTPYGFTIAPHRVRLVSFISVTISCACYIVHVILSHDIISNLH